MIFDFIKGILSGLTQHPGVQWGNTVMETPYEGWRLWIQDMFANMGWGSIFLIALSALTWTGVYIIIIWRLHKDHAPSMPWVCLSMNFSWEFQFAFLVPYPEPVTRWGIYLWVAFDAIMFALDLRYSKMFYAKRFPGYDWSYYIVKLCTFAIIFVSILMMNPQWPNLPDSPMFAAYLMNAIMSIVFCVHCFSRETIEGLSVWVAILKCVGTLAPTALGCIWTLGRPGNEIEYFVYCLGAICAVFDFMYIYLLVKRFARFGINAFPRKPLKGKEELAARTFAAVEDYKERSGNFKLKSYKECQEFLKVE